MTSQGNPAAVAGDQRPGVRAGFRAGTGDLVQHRGDPASSRARRTVGAARGGPEHGGQVREQRDVAHAGGAERDRDRHRDQHDPPVEQRRRALLPQCGAELAGEAGLVGGLAEQDRPGVADQALPVRGDLEGMVPPVKLHGEERSSSGHYVAW